MLSHYVKIFYWKWFIQPQRACRAWFHSRHHRNGAVMPNIFQMAPVSLYQCYRNFSVC